MPEKTLTIASFGDVLKPKMSKKGKKKDYDAKENRFEMRNDATERNCSTQGVLYELLFESLIYTLSEDENYKFPDINKRWISQTVTGEIPLTASIQSAAQRPNAVSEVGDYFRENIIPNIPKAVRDVVLDGIDMLVQGDDSLGKKKIKSLKMAKKQKSAEDFLAEVWVLAVCLDESSKYPSTDEFELAQKANKELPPKTTLEMIRKIRTMGSMATVRKLLRDHTAELNDEICSFGIKHLAECNSAELRKLCQDLIKSDSTDGFLFDRAIIELADNDQSELFKVFEALHLDDSPVFFYYFDKLNLFSDAELRKQFIEAYLPELQEVNFELPVEFEKTIVECNNALRDSQSTINVYSWDQLDFNSVYVVPLLLEGLRFDTFRHTPKELEKTFRDRWTHTSSDDLSANDESIVTQILEDIKNPHTEDYENFFSTLYLNDVGMNITSSEAYSVGDLFYNIKIGRNLRSPSSLDNLNYLGMDCVRSNLALIDTPLKIEPKRLEDLKRQCEDENDRLYKTDATTCGEEDRTKSFDIRNERVGQLFSSDDIVYVIGGAGYGKSLFLKMISVNPSVLQSFDKKPYLIIRGDIKRLINNDGTFKSMSDYLRESFTSGCLHDESELHPDFLMKCLKAGRCLVLLDALDEVASDQRNELHRLVINYFRATHPNNKVCVTSRERGFIPLENITCFNIQPIDVAHVEEYVDNFIKLGKFDNEDKVRFLEQSSELVLEGFVKGFLTLSLLMAIYKGEQELPTNKLALYEKCFEYIAITREKRKRLMLNSSTKEEYDWVTLAKLMSDATFMELTQLGAPNNADVSVEKIEEIILSLYEHRFHSSIECKMATEMFLHFCADRTEVFVPSPSSNTDYRFYHRSFYEYFFSRYIEAHTSNVCSTYDMLLELDVDSEIFELLISLYERRNPLYLRELVNYIFERAENFWGDGIPYDSTKPLDILALVMQSVDELDFVERFIDFVLSDPFTLFGRTFTVEFRLIANTLKRNEQYLIDRFNANSSTYIVRIQNQIAEKIVRNKVWAFDLLKCPSAETSLYIGGDIFSQKGFEFYWILSIIPNAEEIFERIFKVFADAKQVILVKDIERKGRDSLMNFARGMNFLPPKNRENVYRALLFGERNWL